MNSTNWTEEQWDAYESAKVKIPVTVLDSLILATDAHILGIRSGKGQKDLWQRRAKTAKALIEKVIAEVDDQRKE